MDNIGAVVSRKIREAIRRKLLKISTFVEDELPDYIMVMVANKRSRAQMEDDLYVFLGEETASFLDWMEKTLVSLQSSPFNEIESMDDDNDLREMPSEETECDVNMIDFLALDASEDVDDLDCELKEEVGKSNINVPNSAHVKPVLEKKCNAHNVMSKIKNENIAIETPIAVQQKIKTIPSSAVFPVKREKRLFSETKSDESKKCFGSVASVIRVSDRKSSVPPSRQANKLLLLRAMDAANKSVRESQKSNKCSQPTPSVNYLQDQKTNSLSENLQNLPNLQAEHSIFNKSMETVKKAVCIDDTVSQTASSNQETSNSIHIYEAPHVKLEVYAAPSHAIDISSKCDKSEDIHPNHQQVSGESIENPEQTSMSSSTRFVVTLGGVDPGILNKKRNLTEMISDDEVDDRSYHRAVEGKDFIQFDDDDMQISEDSNKRQKFNEKCRFWPACKNGNECSFHHPTTSCKSFPNCKYGDRCLYIHPNCKFDALCSRKDCHYTHASKRKLSQKVVPISKRVGKLNGICKYFPNCQSRNCSYNHPKSCWYGTQCTVAGCTYDHSVPSRDRLKWCA